MFVRQDKIPDQLKLCSVRVLRRRMVRYLSDAANFTRFDEADDSVLASLSDFIFTFLRHRDHTIGDSTWTAWTFDLLARPGFTILAAIHLLVISTDIQEVVTAPNRSPIGKAVLDDLCNGTARSTPVIVLTATVMHCIRALALNGFLS